MNSEVVENLSKMGIDKDKFLIIWAHTWLSYNLFGATEFKNKIERLIFQ